MSLQQPLEFPDGIYGLSIGAILATALAYRVSIENIQLLFQTVSVDQFLPAVRLPNLFEAPDSKGIYSTDALAETIRSVFMKLNIDLSIARIKDAPQPLHIVASNITRCTPTIFEGDVLILDALRASCALPGVFHPHVIYDSAYLDGCLYVSSMIDTLPAHIRDTALIINLSRRNRGIPPEMISHISPFKFTEMVYQGVSQFRLKTTHTQNTVILFNESTDSLDLLTVDQQQALVDSGSSQFALWSKRLAEPCLNTSSLE